MGLFRRKRDPDFIDLGDQVAVSSERADEMADTALERISDLYEEPVASEIHEAMVKAIQHRHPDLGQQLLGMLASTAKMGYAARLYEEDFDSIDAEVPMLTEELQHQLEAGESTSDAVASVALALSDYRPSDPKAPRSLDAIKGIGGLRDPIAMKTAGYTVAIARDAGLAEKGSFPAGIEARDLIAAWRIGFLVRSCEASLPRETELTADTKRRAVVVDVEAVQEAFGEWVEDNLESSQDEQQAMLLNLLQDPRFHVDLDSDDVSDDEARYSVIEMDQMGRILPQRD